MQTQSELAHVSSIVSHNITRFVFPSLQAQIAEMTDINEDAKRWQKISER